MIDKAEIFKRAQWFEMRYRLSRYNAIRTAITEQRLEHALKTQELVYFVFKKLNGELRTVLATKFSSLIPNEIKPTNRVSYTELQVRFVDTNLGAWRSCRIDKMVRIYW